MLGLGFVAYIRLLGLDVIYLITGHLLILCDCGALRVVNPDWIIRRTDNLYSFRAAYRRLRLDEREATCMPRHQCYL
jgi:hypothetical protein